MHRSMFLRTLGPQPLLGTSSTVLYTTSDTKPNATFGTDEQVIDDVDNIFKNQRGSSIRSLLYF